MRDDRYEGKCHCNDKCCALADRWLISLFHKELFNPPKNNIDGPIERLAKDMNRLFTSKENEVVFNYLKRYSTFLIIKEMQIKIIRYNS